MCCKTSFSQFMSTTRLCLEAPTVFRLLLVTRKRKVGRRTSVEAVSLTVTSFPLDLDLNRGVIQILQRVVWREQEASEYCIRVYVL